MHALGYASSIALRKDANVSGVFDAEYGSSFAEKAGGVRRFDSVQGLFLESDAIIVCSENKRHAQHIELACSHRKPVLCEKPLVTSEEEIEQVRESVSRTGGLVMTAFPCAYAPSFEKLAAKVNAGEIGQVKAICATNHGRCPFSWFIDPEMSGGGALMDHTVHVADLLRRLLGMQPKTVMAQVSNRMLGEEVDDTAMLTLQYENGVFATLDASWSRPESYKTWGDVTLKVVGEKGVIEFDLFRPALDRYRNSSMQHSLAGYGSDLDALLVEDFIQAIHGNKPPRSTWECGVEASRIAIAGYRSVLRGEPVPLPV